MPAKRATPVIIETPFPSTEQVARRLRQLDGEIRELERSMPRSRNPTTIAVPHHKRRVDAWALRLAKEAKKAAVLHKYDALTKWLRAQKKSPVAVSFEDLEDEDKIGMNLPYSAWDRTWWTNEQDPQSSQSRAWLDAGWKVQSVDPDREVATFVRIGAS
jgi:hypothetical protein